MIRASEPSKRVLTVAVAVLAGVEVDRPGDGRDDVGKADGSESGGEVHLTKEWEDISSMCG